MPLLVCEERVNPTKIIARTLLEALRMQRIATSAAEGQLFQFKVTTHWFIFMHVEQGVSEEVRELTADRAIIFGSWNMATIIGTRIGTFAFSIGKSISNVFAREHGRVRGGRLEYICQFFLKKSPNRTRDP